MENSGWAGDKSAYRFLSVAGTALYRWETRKQAGSRSLVSPFPTPGNNMDLQVSNMLSWHSPGQQQSQLEFAGLAGAAADED
jgi:hypothetical protein